MDTTGFFNPFLSTTNGGGGGSGGPVIATKVQYNNSKSGLPANNVQDAIDEVAAAIKQPISAEKVFYDNKNSGLESENTQDAIDKLVDILKTINASILNVETIGYGLFPELWTDNEYHIVSEKIKENDYICLDMARGITLEEYASLAKAKIINTEQSNGEIIIKALGDVPEMVIPIAITFFSKKPLIGSVIWDSVTNIPYQFAIEDKNVMLREVDIDLDDYDLPDIKSKYIITDSITGISYQIIIKNKEVDLQEVDT